MDTLINFITSTAILLASLAFLTAIFFILLSLAGIIIPNIYKKQFGTGPEARQAITTKRFLPAFGVFFVCLIVIINLGGTGETEKKEPAQKTELNDMDRVEAAVKKKAGRTLESYSEHSWASPVGRAITVHIKTSENWKQKKAIEQDIAHVMHAAYCGHKTTDLKNAHVSASVNGQMAYKVNMSATQAASLDCSADQDAYLFLEVIPKLWTTQFIRNGL